MKTLALANGDLVIGPTGHRTISGAPKIRQELALSMGEAVGTDRFHPDMGSVLIDFVGQQIDAETEALVRAEVGRVIQQYIAIQAREVLKDHLAQRSSRFDASDVVVGVTSIQAQISFDKISVSAMLVTQSGASVQVNRTVTV